MKIIDYFNKDNLHHAYLIEGEKEIVLPEIINFFNSINVKMEGNPDFFNISYDSIKIDDARKIKEYSVEKSISGGSKFFIITANNFLLEAQNTLLKIFEEPAPNTHFFIIIPDSDIILRTLYSRFFVIKTSSYSDEYIDEAGKFLSKEKQERINYLKEFLLNEKEEYGDAQDKSDSPRIKSIKLLNAIEVILNNKILKEKSFEKIDFFDHILKVREFLNMPGSSHKTLMESVALCVPVIK